MRFLAAAVVLLASCLPRDAAAPIPDISSQVLDAVVALVMREDGDLVAYCAGSFVDGYVLTAQHCVDNAEGGTVRVATREDVRLNQRTFAASTWWRVAKTDANADLVLLSPIKPKRGHPQLHLSPNLARVGQTVVAIGHPLTWPYSISVGEISNPSRVWYGMPPYLWTQATMHIDRGYSGGPLLNRYGEILGVTSFMIGRSIVGFAHLEDVRKLLGGGQDAGMAGN